MFGERKLKMQALETQRLILRKFDQDDLKDIVAWEGTGGAQMIDVEARRFLDYCFREYRKRGIGPWGMQLKETRAVVGNCGFPHIFKNHCGEVNYFVAPQYRGRGLASESLEAILEFGFRDLGFAQIQARCDSDNLSSERVMQKAGMRFQGLVENPPSSKDPSSQQKLYAIFRRSANHDG